MRCSSIFSFLVLVMVPVANSLPQRNSKKISKEESSETKEITIGSRKISIKTKKKISGTKETPSVTKEKTSGTKEKVSGTKDSVNPVFTCEGGVRNSCQEDVCTFTCGDGTEMEMECEDGKVYVSLVNGKSKVFCGKVAPEVDIPSCFPWCDRGPPKIPTFPPCFPFCNMKNA